MRADQATVRRVRVLLDPRQARRVVAWLLYASVGVRLPWSPRPFGKLSRRFRAALGGAMLDRCGQNVNIEHGAWFGSGRGIELGDNSDIGMDALVVGSVRIGADVMMGPRCVLVSSAHAHADVSVPMNRQGWTPERTIVIEDDVWLGAGVIVLPGVVIGRGSIIGAGAVVTKDVPPFSVAAGNPARVVRSRLPADDPRTVDRNPA